MLTQWDKVTCQERLEQIQDELSPLDTAVLVAFLQQMGGASLDRMGLLNALHWWVLGTHEPLGLNRIALHTRLSCGHSELHQRIFTHACSTGRLSYRFNAAVTHIKDMGNTTTVTTRDGSTYTATSVVCTVPLNVLSSIVFDPALSVGKQAAATAGQVNHCNKVHVDLRGPDYMSWTAFSSPGQGLICAIGDRLTPRSDSHMVSFGPDPSAANGVQLKDIDGVKSAFLAMVPAEKRPEVVINRIVSIPPHKPRRQAWQLTDRFRTTGIMTNFPRALGATFRSALHQSTLRSYRRLTAMSCLLVPTFQMDGAAGSMVRCSQACKQHTGS